MAAAFAYNGDLPGVNLWAMTFPVALILHHTANLPFSQLWAPNHTQGRYWIALRHYAVKVLGTFRPVSVPLGGQDGVRLALELGAGGGAFWLSKQIRSRTGKAGSLAGDDVWTIRPGAVGAARLRLAGGRFGFALEYQFQFVPPVENVNPPGDDYDVTGSTAYLAFGFAF